MKIKDRAKPALPPVPAGQYLAVCVGVYDLGEQYSEKYKNYSPKLMISFDIPSVTIEVEGKMEPRQLSREFTITTKNNSKLREFISSWNGTQYSDEAFGEFDPLTQVGKPAMINVLLNETGEYANINTIMPLFPGLPAPTTTTPLRVWDMDKWDDKAFEDLPAWVQEKIKKSSEYQKEHVPQTDVTVQPVAAAQPAGNVMPGMDYQALMQQMMNQQTTAAPTATLQNNGGAPF